MPESTYLRNLRNLRLGDCSYIGFGQNKQKREPQITQITQMSMLVPSRFHLFVC